MNVHAEYILDENSNTRSVIIPYSEWREIVEELEELDDIKAYDQARHEANIEVIDFEQAVTDIKTGKIV
ncbi:hypothetical protein [Thiospirillum jenense]|uniref:Prevent-host-death family protein n=1 Tax=Thiospirillum jenense TaxID=1653858 RepID=A0A839HIL3_9GAMM|nr:hypothetical protein [Thiospirillum jenense]MBB1125912.1 hypothetical protein [Thiospirillum jenense]